MEFVKENERTLPLRDACDVLVAGGGIAGAAAALAAARQGRSVLLGVGFQNALLVGYRVAFPLQFIFMG